MTLKKTLGQLRALPENVDETRTIQFIASTDRKDRHGTVLDLDGWELDAFNNNGIIGYQHDVYGDSILQSPNPDSVIGKGRAFRDANSLLVEVTFEPADINPLAEKVFKKIKFGTLRSTSVGFMPLEPGYWGQGDESRAGKNPTYHYGKRSLLEVSIVNIPSNPDAIMRKFEDELVEEVKEENEDTQKTDSVPEHEQIRLRIDLTKIV
jgi:hypothetical protein